MTDKVDMIVPIEEFMMIQRRQVKLKGQLRHALRVLDHFVSGEPVDERTIINTKEFIAEMRESDRTL